MNETLGKRIVHNRKAKGLTQEALAERLGITAQAVSKWENDQSCPDIATLPKLAEIFGTTTDALLGLESPAKEAELVTQESPALHIDQKDGHWEFKWDGGRKNYVGTALWIISAAVMMLAGNYLGHSVGLWSALWTTGLTVFGLFGLWPKFRVFRLGCALAGGYFIVGELWPRLFVLDKSWLLPIFLLLFGLSLLLDAGKKNKNPSFNITANANGKAKQHYQTSGDRFVCKIAFSELHQPVELPQLSGGTAEVSFGELTLDLSGCERFAKESTLDLKCSFGELTLLIPRGVRAEPSSHTVFADFSVSGHPDPASQNVIYVNADVSFGEITLHYI